MGYMSMQKEMKQEMERYNVIQEKQICYLGSIAELLAKLAEDASVADRMKHEI